MALKRNLKHRHDISTLHSILYFLTLVLSFTSLIDGSSSVQTTSAASPSLLAASASSIINSLAPTSIQTELEAINGSSNFRIYGGKKGKEEKHWLDGRGGIGMQHIQCVRKGSCEKLQFTTCLGGKIPYEYSSLDLTMSHSQKDVQERLIKYQALKHIPKCWAVIQPFLCAIFAPKCEKINGEDMVYLPSLEMCRLTLEPCRLLYNTSYFPEFLKCNETHFPSKCANDVREMKFNLTAQCLDPLVPAESSASYYPGVEGCGVKCKDPLYTDDEHRQIHKLVAWGGCLCLLANLFVVATFIIDWSNASKYPALIVFYINMCFLIACLGWLAQFTPGSREDIVCRKDGTLRHSEPTAGENLSCVVIFVIVYYFLIAAMVWFVFLCYAWHLRAVGNVQDRIDKKGSYFHLVAWSLPLVLTISTLALSEVDGNSIVGVCFVGYLNHPIRAGLLLGPLFGVILIGGYFIVRGMIMLFGLKHFANDIKSTSASNKIHLIIVRMSVCALFTLLFILVAFACHINEFRHSQEWSESLREYITCRIFAPFTEHIKCKIRNRPSVSILQLHLLCLFGAGIVMSTWCWTPSSMETWKRYLRKKCGKDVQQDVKMPKHKVIAQTWAKRKEFEDKGRLSITLYNTHTDPVGLNFDVNDLNSSDTNEISSTWANYLPQFVKRRMALTGAATTATAAPTNSSSQGPRKNSLDSEISFSVRHVSVESRRNSVDSQVSVKIAEMKTKVASRSRSSHHHQNGKHSAKRSQRRRDFITSTKFSGGGRRESSTSIESQLFAMQKTTYPNASHKVGVFAQSSKKQHHHHHSSSNGKRRSATAGLDPRDITQFLAQNGQLILPFLQNQGMTTTSDEETSRASFKVQDSRLDVVVKQDRMSDAESDSHDGPKIEEITDQDDATTLDSLLKTIRKSNDSNGNRRISRNSSRSKQSRKSLGCPSTSSNNNRKSLKRNASRNKSHRISASAANRKNDVDLLNVSDLNLHLERQLECTLNSCNNSLSENSSISSNSVDGPNAAPTLKAIMCAANSSSYSGKPGSRSSKRSADIGIQATNALNISQSSFGDEEIKDCMRKLNNKSRRKSNHHRNYDHNHDDDDDAADEHDLEMQSLLSKHLDKGIIMSESEKLKMLLLPSN